MFKHQWISVCLLLCLTLPFLTFADDDEFEWGEISDEELMMQGIPEDPEADAVILFNIGVLKISPNFGMEMEVHKRIKILTEAGKEFANIEIPFYHEDKIHSLKAEAYDTEGEKTKLDGDDVFEEKINRFWNKKVFAVPGVEIGSVIEFKYGMTSKYIGNLEPWRFQEKEYTKFSQIEVYLPAGYTYSALTMNLMPDDYVQTNEKVRNPYDFDKDCMLYKWTVKDMPGVKFERYMTAYQDYLAQILFQLVAFKDQYRNLKFAKEWDDRAEYVWNEYKDHFDQDGGIEDFTKDLVAGITDPLEKTKKIYDYVRTEIRTTSNTGLMGDSFDEPKKVFNNKEGSTNEKNILLINMLKQVDLDARPLLISTRSNGMINQDWVQIQQFNRVITYTKIGEDEYFLNAGSKYCPFGYLTPEYDVGKGLLVHDKKGKIVSINPVNPDNRLEIEADVQLTSAGDLIGHSHLTFTGMSAVMERDRIEEKDLDEYLEKQIKELQSEAVLDSFKYDAVDSCSKPLALDLYYHIPEYLEDAGTIAYCKLPLLTSENENPFVKEVRKFPVDYDYEYSHSEKVKLTLADDLQVSEKPDKARANMRGVIFNKIYFDVENGIECQRSFKIMKKQFKTREYKSLRDIYEKVVNSDQDQLVLVRK